jgi:hypothetical protein
VAAAASLCRLCFDWPVSREAPIRLGVNQLRATKRRPKRRRTQNKPPSSTSRVLVVSQCFSFETDQILVPSSPHYISLSTKTIIIDRPGAPQRAPSQAQSRWVCFQGANRQFSHSEVNRLSRLNRSMKIHLNYIPCRATRRRLRTPGRRHTSHSTTALQKQTTLFTINHPV